MNNVVYVLAGVSGVLTGLVLIGAVIVVTFLRGLPRGPEDRRSRVRSVSVSYDGDGITWQMTGTIPSTPTGQRIVVKGRDA
jgi:hypothetical protein